MLILTYRRLGGLDDRRMVLTILKTISVSAAMGAAILVSMRCLPALGGSIPFLTDLFSLGLAATIGGVVYVVLGIVLGQDEILALWDVFKRKLPIFTATRS